MKSNLGSDEASRLLLEEWADLFQVSAAANVLEVGTVFHASQFGAASFAKDGRATLSCQLVSALPRKGTSTR